MEWNILKAIPLGIDWLVVVRVFAGIMIMRHALILFDAEAMRQSAEGFKGMGIPLPAVMAYVAKSAEFFGGLLLLLGLFTHLVSGMLVVNMLVALWASTGFRIFKNELALLFLLCFLVFMLVGGGKYSLDNLFFGK
jgi:putative oxidoreductase